MQELSGKGADDPRGAEASVLFCYQDGKFLSALAAILGGSDSLVFTAGIGENAPPFRSRIREGMEFLGIRLNPPLNSANAAVISTESSRVRVRVMKTDEAIMIARYMKGLIRSRASPMTR
jgi:acetate kinase